MGVVGSGPPWFRVSPTPREVGLGAAVGRREPDLSLPTPDLRPRESHFASLLGAL